MKRSLTLAPWIAAGITFLGLAGAGSAIAGSTQGAGAHRASTHVMNLHQAYEARLGQATPGPIAGIAYAMGEGPPSTLRGGNGCAEPYCPVSYHGGPVQHSPHVYLLFWGRDWLSDPNQKATASYLKRFYSGLGVEPQDNWSILTDQYGDSTGSPTFGSGVFEGAYYDTSKPPADPGRVQFAAEADAFTKKHDITDLTDAQIVIATQSGICPAGFPGRTCPSGGTECAWHDSSNEPFTNLPYLLDAGSACGKDSVNPDGTHDGFSIVGGHEYAESITDPYPFTGWMDPYDHLDLEIADKCGWNYLTDVKLHTGTFAMQALWSNAANHCETSIIHHGDITMDGPGTQSDYQYTKQVSLQMIGTSSHHYQLTWKATGLPSGLTINTSSGLISGQAAGSPGTYTVTISASDRTTSSPVTVTFTWIVSADVGSIITNTGSGKCLNDYQWVATPGNEIVLWKCQDGPPEMFSNPANTGELVVLGQCLTDPGTGRRGTIQKIFPCTGASDQEWYHNSSGEYVLTAKNVCLTDPADAIQNGTPIVVEKCTNASDQEWVGP